jgi:hypothetical protein
MILPGFKNDRLPIETKIMVGLVTGYWYHINRNAQSIFIGLWMVSTNIGTMII